jgi:hypothetical protein
MPRRWPYMNLLPARWILPGAVRGEGLNFLCRLLSARLAGRDLLTRALKGLQPSILEFFRREELAPWLFSLIARYGLQAEVDGALLEIMRQEYVDAVGPTAEEEQEISQVLQALSLAGVEAIPLKGADLRHRVYDDPIVRPMVDLDLLIPETQIDISCSTLESLGFRLQPKFIDPRPGFRQRYRREIHLDPPPNLPLMVDLHWQLDHPDHFYAWPLSRLRRMAVSANFSGCHIKLLCPEHAYLLLLTHGCDGFHGTMQLVDFVLTPQALAVDWGKFLEEVVRFQCQAPAYLMLREITGLVPGAAPPWVLHFLSGYSPAWSERWVLRRSLGELTVHFANLYRQKDWRDRLLYLGTILWPQPSYLQGKYGTSSRVKFYHKLLKEIFSSASPTKVKPDKG